MDVGGAGRGAALPRKPISQQHGRILLEGGNVTLGCPMERSVRTVKSPFEQQINSPGLQLIYETAPIGLAFLSTDCRYLMINQHLTEICGISIAEHIGRTVRETVPQVADQVEEVVKTIVRTGEPVIAVEVNGQRLDGSNTDRVWITYWHPLKNRAGEVIGINVAAEEITERKRTEAALAASQKELRELNEKLARHAEAQAQERDRIWTLTGDLLAVTDAGGVLLSVNPAWSMTLGWSAADLVGKNGEWLVHPDDRERSQAELAGLLLGRQTRHLENRMLCKDGSYRSLSWFAVQDRGLIYAAGRDVSDLKQVSEQLEALRRQLADASRQAALGAMTGSLAHEIRQPLAAIVTNASAGLRWLTRSDPDVAEARASLERIGAEVSRANEVIAGIRAMFAKESGKVSTVDIRPLVAEVLALARGELSMHQIVLRNDMKEDLPHVRVSPVQLQQVILNLVMNAVEAMSTVTSRDRRLTITSGLDAGANIKISIADSGSGIEVADLQRIFEPFFTTKSDGMGLGLAVSRSIIEAHGGHLWATSNGANGSAFHLILPSVPS
jgi:PAS domain S-box-containing protein